jgi:peptidoglycan/LPS O-acetylase OafA/YrhL
VKTGKINVLTSFRFFAASTVVIGHSIPLFGLSETALRYFPAHDGVTFFFVLSGFILTFTYRQLNTSERVWHFIVARFARLWPLHATTFMLAIILLQDAADTLLTPLGLAEAVLNIAMLQSLVPIFAFQFSYNAVSWSVSDEIFFYACFIGLLPLLGRSFMRVLAIGMLGPLVMVGICIALALPYYDPNYYSLSAHTMVYLHPVARLLEFVIGMIAASLFLRFGVSLKAATSPGLATVLEIFVIGLMVASVALDYWAYVRIWPSAPSALLLWLERSGSAPIYALGILVLAFERGHVSRYLGHPTLVLLGEISFAIYLVHQIILRWLAAHPAILASLPVPLAYGLFLAVVLTVSWVLWRFVEKPARAALLKRLTAPGVPTRQYLPAE